MNENVYVVLNASFILVLLLLAVVFLQWEITMRNYNHALDEKGCLGYFNLTGFNPAVLGFIPSPTNITVIRAP